MFNVDVSGYLRDEMWSVLKVSFFENCLSLLCFVSQSCVFPGIKKLLLKQSITTFNNLESFFDKIDKEATCLRLNWRSQKIVEL